MPKRREYAFTHHLRERFIQRTQKKYEHIQRCHDKECPICKELVEECRKEIGDNRKKIDTEIARRLDEATENRAYINSTEFMSRYYEKYGYDKPFEFLTHEDILFVVVTDNGRKVVVTCVPSKNHIAGSKRVKYVKKD